MILEICRGKGGKKFFGENENEIKLSTLVVKQTNQVRETQQVNDI
jgi:hypothetical protein